MKEIIINSETHGVKKVLVDDKDFQYLNQFTWCAHKIGSKFYAIRKVQRTITVMMHREILGVSAREVYIDHIDGNGLNNQRDNLRLADHSDNLCNRGAVKNSKSKYKGVGWVSSHKLWRATIQKNKVSVSLGYFKDEIEAAKAYDAVAKEIHGEFAYLNFPENAGV